MFYSILIFISSILGMTADRKGSGCASAADSVTAQSDGTEGSRQHSVTVVG
jgi:hypothetical protein